MKLEEIKVWLEQNKDNEEVKAFVGGLSAVNLDKIKSLASTDKDIKAWLDSEKDTHYNKAKKTWDENQLPKLLEEEIKKRFPEADPKDIKIKEFEAKLEQMQKETARKDLTNKAIKIATEKKLPVELVDFLIGENEELTTKNLEKLETVFGAKVEAVVKERMGQGSYTPPVNGGGAGEITFEYLTQNADKMTSQQIAEAYAKLKNKDK